MTIKELRKMFTKRVEHLCEPSLKGYYEVCWGALETLYEVGELNVRKNYYIPDEIMSLAHAYESGRKIKVFTVVQSLDLMYIYATKKQARDLMGMFLGIETEQTAKPEPEQLEETVAEPEQEKVESEAPEQETDETTKDAETKSYEINWFAERFLASIFEMTEPLNPLWLTRKQTAVCAKNMKKSVTRDDFGEHISYHIEWNGRNVEMLYSKKNQCGSIRFSRNVEEQAEADKKAIQEIDKLEYERLQTRIESIKNGNQRTINAVTQRYNRLKERIEEMNEDIAEGFYTVNEICYVKAKKELAMYSAIIAETGLKI